MLFRSGQLGSKCFVQLLPESRSELGASIRHNFARDSMQANNLSNVKISKMVSTISGPDRNKVSNFGESVHDNPYRIISSAGPR